MKKIQVANKKKQLRKPISDNFAPKRLAISYEPPMIIIEYLVIDTGKLYHHKMRLDSVLKKKNLTRDDVLNYIKNKHYLYFVSNKVKDAQVLKFIDKILSKLGKNTNKSNNTLGGNPQVIPTSIIQDDDFDYLNDDEEYEQDYEDYQDPGNEIITQGVKKQNAFLTYCPNKDEQMDQAQASWDLDMDQNADFV